MDNLPGYIPPYDPESGHSDPPGGVYTMLLIFVGGVLALGALGWILQIILSALR